MGGNQPSSRNHFNGINKAAKQVGLTMSTGGDITAEGRSELYGMAADCAIKIQSNSLAIEYAQKSIKADPQSVSKILLTYAIANSGVQKLESNDAAGALPLFETAITNYEAISNIHVRTNSEMTANIIMLYKQGAAAAWILGNKSQSDEWQQKAAALMK
jgi:hypothetical protein